VTARLTDAQRHARSIAIAIVSAGLTTEDTTADKIVVQVDPDVAADVIRSLAGLCVGLLNADKGDEGPVDFWRRYVLALVASDFKMTGRPDLYAELLAAIDEAASAEGCEYVAIHEAARNLVTSHDLWCRFCANERDPVLCVSLHDIADAYLPGRLAEVGYQFGGAA
jgi:hypothetical protein